MKLSLFGCAATLVALSTASVASFPEPHFGNCTISQQGKLDAAIPDAINISHLASSAIHLALQSANNLTTLETDPGLSAANVSVLLERWFGKDVLPVTPAGVANSEHLYEHYTRMHDLLANSSLPYRCVAPETMKDNGTPLCPPDVLAFVRYHHDMLAGTKWMSASHSGINFCPESLEPKNITWQRMVHLWEGHGKNETLLLGWSMPIIMIHEMSHQMAVERPQVVIDVPTVNENYTSDSHRKAYRPQAAQLLAMADTNLAMHNAANYALFAAEVAITSMTGVLPPETDDRPFLREVVYPDGHVEYERASHHEAAEYVHGRMNKTELAAFASGMRVIEALRIVTETATSTKATVTATTVL
ncbi:hypothetical protein LTR85_003470 [Meristemomyces frigidus]|nr:hypothetical protein LTR85_003470 [Meristemomyces frigidus]